MLVAAGVDDAAGVKLLVGVGVGDAAGAHWLLAVQEAPGPENENVSDVLVGS